MCFKNTLTSLLFTAFIALVFTGCSMSPEKVLNKFEEAIEEKDAEALYKLVEVEDEVYWSEKEAKSVIDYFNKDKGIYGKQLDLLQTQKDALKAKETLDNGTGMFYFDEEKKFNIRTYNLSLDEVSFASFEQLAVSVSDKEEFTVEGASTGDVKLGLFGPGYYYVEARADYGYLSLDDKDSVELFSFNEFDVVSELDLAGEEALVLSTIPDTKLYINDVAIDMEIDGDQDLGTPVKPVIEGLKFQGKIETPWGDIVSEEIEYEGPGMANQVYEVVGKFFPHGVNVTPHIFGTEQEREEIAHIIAEFYEKLLTALVKNDESLLSDVIATDEVKESYKYDFEDLTTSAKGETVKKNYGGIAMPDIHTGYYEGKLDETTIDFSYVEHEIDEDTKEDLLAIQTYLYTDFKFIFTGLTGVKYSEGNRFLNTTVYLKKENDQWIIARQVANFHEEAEKEVVGEDHIKIKAGK